MTDAERDLLLYMARKLATHADPTGEVAREIWRLHNCVVAETKYIERG
jgi:hypothetical protein